MLLINQESFFSFSTISNQVDKIGMVQYSQHEELLIPLHCIPIELLDYHLLFRPTTGIQIQ